MEVLWLGLQIQCLIYGLHGATLDSVWLSGRSNKSHLIDRALHPRSKLLDLCVGNHPRSKNLDLCVGTIPGLRAWTSASVLSEV
jgi:hypothetical protein